MAEEEKTDAAEMLRAIEAETEATPEPSPEERLAALKQELQSAQTEAEAEKRRAQDALAQAASLRSKADSLTAAADRDGQTIAQKDAALEAAKKAAEEEAAKFAAEADTLQAELNGEREGRAEDRQRLEEQIAKNMSKATKAEDRASKWRFFSGVAAVLSIIAAIVMMYIYSEYNSAVADAESYRTSLEVLRDTNVQLSAQIRALKAGGQPQAPAVAEEGEETTPAETRPASPPPAAPKSSEPTSFDEM